MASLSFSSGSEGSSLTSAPASKCPSCHSAIGDYYQTITKLEVQNATLLAQLEQALKDKEDARDAAFGLLRVFNSDKKLVIHDTITLQGGIQPPPAVPHQSLTGIVNTPSVKVVVATPTVPVGDLLCFDDIDRSEAQSKGLSGAAACPIPTIKPCKLDLTIRGKRTAHDEVAPNAYEQVIRALPWSRTPSPESHSSSTSFTCSTATEGGHLIPPKSVLPFVKSKLLPSSEAPSGKKNQPLTQEDDDEDGPEIHYITSEPPAEDLGHQRSVTLVGAGAVGVNSPPRGPKNAFQNFQNRLSESRYAPASFRNGVSSRPNTSTTRSGHHVEDYPGGKPLFFIHGLYYIPDSTKSPLDTRQTITISNLPPTLPLKSLFPKIRGGAIVSCTLVPTPSTALSIKTSHDSQRPPPPPTQTAFIRFHSARAALAYSEFAAAHPEILTFTLDNEKHKYRATARLLETATYPLSAARHRSVYEQQRTRCLQIRHFPKRVLFRDFVEELLRHGWAGYSQVEKVIERNIKEVAGGRKTLQVGFASVWAAEQAFEVLTTWKVYDRCEVAFIEDECAGALEDLLLVEGFKKWGGSGGSNISVSSSGISSSSSSGAASRDA